MNEAASTLGKLARGVPKRYSAEEIAKRTHRLALARDKRAREKKIGIYADRAWKAPPVVAPEAGESIGMP